MLVSLHVKNLALIKETEVNFKPGLNILSGETGAGKSIIIGSINLALGARADKDMIRNGAEYALVEVVFQIDNEEQRTQIERMDIPVEDDGCVIIQRKILENRSQCKVCGETVSTKQLKELAELLIDIHGQHEHQSLLNKRKHLEILDAFAGDALCKVTDKVAVAYRTYTKIQSELEEFSTDDTLKKKELALAEFEYDEIEAAKLLPDEDIEVEQSYRKMVNSKKIMESLSVVGRCIGGDDAGAATEIGRATRELKSIMSYDAEAANLAEELENIDNLLNDFSRNLSDYMDSCEFDAEDFNRIEERLNVINHLKSKYGNSIAEIKKYQDELAVKLERLQNADAYKQKLEVECKKALEELDILCDKASQIRMKEAKKLAKDMTKALMELNFLEVNFEIQVRRKENYSTIGYDDVEFMISTNPGEPLKSLGNVASGGELSRIMLAIKTVLAAKDQIHTMIFDEIDAGISGKTAWKVSEKMGVLAREHQIICITHLPQIAAMADSHYLIQKAAVSSGTETSIEELRGEEVIEELARLLGGEVITDTVRENAKELIATAKKAKQ